MDNLISKKELLSLTKISYGQLYRWKRMNIIPEDWFIKKSTVTGQETFFEKDKILKRIEFILSKKDEVSLEEIAELLKGSQSQDLFRLPNKESGELSPATLDVFYSMYPEHECIDEKELCIIALIDQYLVHSYITHEELKLIAGVIEKNFPELNTEEGKIYLYRKFGIPFVIASNANNSLFVEDTAVRILEVEVKKSIALIKEKCCKEQ